MMASSLRATIEVPVGRQRRAANSMKNPVLPVRQQRRPHRRRPGAAMTLTMRMAPYHRQHHQCQRQRRQRATLQRRTAIFGSSHLEIASRNKHRNIRAQSSPSCEKQDATCPSGKAAAHPPSVFQFLPRPITPFPRAEGQGGSERKIASTVDRHVLAVLALQQRAPRRKSYPECY